eukprot:990414-Rhodomonas_salina.2
MKRLPSISLFLLLSLPPSLPDSLSPNTLLCPRSRSLRALSLVCSPMRACSPHEGALLLACHRLLRRVPATSIPELSTPHPMALP